jgi:hypothetical protein
VSYLSSPADAFAQSLCDMVRADWEVRASIQQYADWDGWITYLATLVAAMREVAPDHPVLRDDVCQAYRAHGRRLSLAGMHRRQIFNAWDYANHALYDAPAKVAAELDRQTQVQRERLVLQLLEGVKAQRRLCWYLLWMWGPQGVTFLGHWWPESAAGRARAWRDLLVAELRGHWGGPGPCPTVQELVRRHPPPLRAT